MAVRYGDHLVGLVYRNALLIYNWPRQHAAGRTFWCRV